MEEELKDHYAILEVNEDATERDIKVAYRRLAKEYHPDKKPGGDPDKFKDIKASYELLADREQRERYDYERKQTKLARHQHSGPSSKSHDLYSEFIYNTNKGHYHREPKTPLYYDTPSVWGNFYGSYGQPHEPSAKEEYLSSKGDNRRYSPEAYSKTSTKYSAADNKRDDEAVPPKIVRTKSRKHGSERTRQDSRAKDAQKEPYIEEYEDYSSPIPSKDDLRTDIANPSARELETDLVRYTSNLLNEKQGMDKTYKWLNYCWQDYIDHSEVELCKMAERTFDQIAENINILEDWHFYLHQQASRASRKERWHTLIQYAQEQLSGAREMGRAVTRAGEIQLDMAKYRKNYQTGRVSIDLQRKFVREIRKCQPLRPPPSQSQDSKVYTYRIVKPPTES